MSADPRISVVIPTLNEASELPETLRRVVAIPEVLEILVVDGGSQDATVAFATAAGCQVVSSQCGRGNQLRTGTELARGELVLMLHADTWLPPNAGSALIQAVSAPSVVAGGFWKQFRHPHWLMRGSRWRCWTRLQFFGRVAADQGIFVRRDVLQRAGGVPNVPLMEEFELCRRLRPFGRLVLADATVLTSSRRWRERGVVRTYVRMWEVTFLYYLGYSPEALAVLYEGR